MEPAATLALAGTVTAALFEDRATLDPPEGAGCDNVTVQAALPPEFSEVGEHWSADTVTEGVTVTAAVTELPFSAAVNVTARFVDTAPADAVKEAVLEPAVTVTDEGTIRAASLDERVTLSPPASAARDSVTVQAAPERDGTLVGEHCNAARVIGEMVTAVDLELPLREAVIVAVWLLVTLEAVAVTFPLLAPAAILIEAATGSAELSEERVAVTPPVGAACDRVTEQVVDAPELTEDGEHCRVEIVTGSTVIVAVAELLPSDPVRVTL